MPRPGQPWSKSVSAWYSVGDRVPTRFQGTEYDVWARAQGTGPVTTFWHGFPTCSYDWTEVEARLPDAGRRVYVDHLGYGRSAKPRTRYTFDMQLNAARDVWDHFGTTETALVVHDYSVSMAQEMLARIVEGTWDGPVIREILFLNGGLFYDAHKPLPIQRLLWLPVTGPIMGRLVTPRTFDRVMKRIMAPDRPIRRSDMEALWALMMHNGGRGVYHRLSKYRYEREKNVDRWTEALARTAVPLRFGWGLLDPISGPVADVLLDRVPDATLIAWEDLGHYPQLEDPDRVAEAVLPLLQVDEPLVVPA